MIFSDKENRSASYVVVVVVVVVVVENTANIRVS